MNNKNDQEGVSVKEIEQFAKRNRFEVFFAALFVLASLFSLFMYNSTFTILSCLIGAIIGVFFPKQVLAVCRKIYEFVFKQERITQMVLAGCTIVVGIFLSPVIFLFLSAAGAMGLVNFAKDIAQNSKK